MVRREKQQTLVIGLGLLILMIVGAMVSVGVFVAAKMIGATGSISDDMPVAKWDIEVEPVDSDDVDLVAGRERQAYALNVINNSEVASSYKIKVSGVPANVKVGLDVRSDDDLQEPVGGEVVFSNTGGALGFDDGNNTRTHVLALKAMSGANVISGDGVDMTVELEFMQEDPR